MAVKVDVPPHPRWILDISFAEEGKAFERRYVGNARWVVIGERYDPDEVPKRVLFKSSHKTIPDFALISARLSLSPEARALVEQFEPGVHQFFPVEVVRPRSKKPIHRLDGRVLDGPYHLFFPQVWLDAVLVERSEVKVSHPADGGPPHVRPIMGSDKVVLRREVVAGHHVWTGGNHLPGRTFFSDALAREVERRKLRKLDFVHLEEA